MYVKVRRFGRLYDPVSLEFRHVIAILLIVLESSNDVFEIVTKNATRGMSNVRSKRHPISDTHFGHLQPSNFEQVRDGIGLRKFVGCRISISLCFDIRLLA